METIFKIAVVEYLNYRYKFSSVVKTNNVVITKIGDYGFDYIVKTPEVSGFYFFNY